MVIKVISAVFLLCLSLSCDDEALITEIEEEKQDLLKLVDDEQELTKDYNLGTLNPVTIDSNVLEDDIDNSSELQESNTLEETTESAKPAGKVPVSLEARLYPGWCAAGSQISNSKKIIGQGSDLQTIVDKAASEGGGVVEISGSYTLSRPLIMKSNVVLRGNPNATIRSNFGSSQGTMIQFHGGGGFQKIGTVSSAPSFSNSIKASVNLEPGFYMVGEAEKSGGQVIKVESANGNQGQLELPLSQDFSGRDLYRHTGNFVQNAGLQNLTLLPQDPITDIVLVKTSTNITIKDVVIDGSGGQQKASIFLSYAYKNSVINNTLTDPAQLGDGGRGYGINIANVSANNLIQGNKLTKFRHSILFNTGASGNVVQDNNSSQARHPNFQEGGPADMSFHGYASGNLVADNTLLRSHIGDDTVPGPNNVLLFNTFTSGPLTIQGDDGKPLDNLTLVGNKWTSSPEEMYSKLISDANAMQPIPSSKSNPSLNSPRKLWTSNYNPFVGPNSSDPRLQRGVGILDLDKGQGADIYVDEDAAYFSAC